MVDGTINREKHLKGREVERKINAHEQVYSNSSRIVRSCVWPARNEIIEKIVVLKCFIFRGGPFDIWGGGVEENMEINEMFPILIKINKLFPSLLEINKIVFEIARKKWIVSTTK